MLKALFFCSVHSSSCAQARPCGWELHTQHSSGEGRNQGGVLSRYTNAASSSRGAFPLRAVAAPPGSDLPIPEVIAAASGSVPPLPSNPTPPLSAAPMGSRGQPGPCRHARAPCEAQGPRSFSRLLLGSEPAGPLGLAPEPRHDELRIPAPLRARCPGTCDRATSPGPPGEAGGLEAGGGG